jgi:hypothetical protein
MSCSTLEAGWIFIGMSWSFLEMTWLSFAMSWVSFGMRRSLLRCAPIVTNGNGLKMETQKSPAVTVLPSLSHFPALPNAHYKLMILFYRRPLAKNRTLANQQFATKSGDFRWTEFQIQKKEGPGVAQIVVAGMALQLVVSRPETSPTTPPSQIEAGPPSQVRSKTLEIIKFHEVSGPRKPNTRPTSFQISRTRA